MILEEIEAVYSRKVFYHYDKILKYKIMHAQYETNWNGDYSKNKWWIYGITCTGKSSWAHIQRGPDSPLRKSN